MRLAILSAGVTIIVILIGMGIYFTQQPTNPEINLKLQADSSVPKDGELKWTITVKSNRKTVATIQSELFDPAKKQGYFLLGDTITVNNKAVKNYKIRVPTRVLPGNYQLRVTVNAESKRVLGLQPVVVRAAKITSETIALQAGSKQKTPSLRQTPLINPIDNKLVESEKEQTQKKDVITTIPPKPSLTEQIPIVACDHDEDPISCTINQAIASGDATQCNQLDSPELKDSCYAEFIYSGKTQYCILITNPDVKNYCEVVI